jgi:uncharacterized protein (DUF2249 family)
VSGAPRVVKRLDGRPLRAAGIHPVEQVLAELAALGPGEAYEFVSPHPPQPLLEKTGPGIEARCEEAEPGVFVTTFTRRG